MSSRFKFLRRVRIHGGECDAVARALHHEAQKGALTQVEQTLISDEKAFLSQADLERVFGSTSFERKQMSTKTSIKRIALVAVSALGVGLLSVVPAKAADSTLLASSVTGTVVAPASTATATGTFSVNLRELAAATWTSGVTAITLVPADEFGTTTTCAIKANDDGTPYGTVSVTGTSDSMYSSVASLPTLSVASGALTVTVGTTTAGQIEDIRISGLVVKCSNAAPVGRIFLKVTAGGASIKAAKVSLTGTVNQAAVATDTSVAVRFSGSASFPVFAAYEAVNNVAAAFVSDTGAQVRETTNAITASPLWGTTPVVTAAALATDLVTKAGHSLRTGDYVYVDVVGGATGLTAATTYRAVVNDANTFYLVAATAAPIPANAINITANGAPTILYVGAGIPATLGLAGAAANYNVGSTVTLPASAATVDAYGAATSTVWLGKIGDVNATYKYYTTGTQAVAGTGISFTTTATAGQISIDDVTGGAIVDGGVTPPTVAVTLTNGVFYSAPTVGGATIASTQTYPNATLNLKTITGNITITGTYRFDAGVAAGSYLTFAVAVTNDTAPTGYIPSALVAPSLNRIGLLSGASLATATLPSLTIATPGSVLNPVTVTETTAGLWKPGTDVAICFTDASGDLFYTAKGNIPWATVTSGDLKLAGNVSTLKGAMRNGSDVTANTLYNNAVANQCVVWTVYSASTTASTITVYGSNADASAAGTTGPVMSTGVAAGNGLVGAFGGGNASALGGGTGNMVLLAASNVFNRVNAPAYSVTTGTVPAITAPGTAQSYADVTITEAAKGTFAAGAVTVSLTDSIGAASTAASLSAAVGANAPVVTQTNAASDIAWTYAVAGNTVTITVVTPSSLAPATFKVTNLKANTIGVNAAGVATSNSDLYVTATGGGLLGQIYTVQGATTTSSATSTADALLALAKAIGTGKDANAAADAALEATDAANAATDAANLAAEAADAATMAAQDAKDAADAATAAVEALAQQVSTMIDALKAQLATLAATVAKIAKKVKA